MKSSMLNSYYRVYESAKDALVDEGASLGFAVMILSRCAERRSVPVSYLSYMVLEAIRQRNIKFYFDSEGRPVAYVMWARLDQKSEVRLMRSRSPQLSPADWNEGENLWIMDLAAPGGHLSYVLADMRDHLFSGESELKYFRMKGGKFIPKLVSRESKSAFFSAPALSRGCACGSDDCSFA